jgi:hypothetical protein
MRFNGEWLQCDDGVVRPVLRAEILAGANDWRRVELLIDTGADRTVLSAHVLAMLMLPHAPVGDRLAGAGGLIDTVAVRTQLSILRDDGIPVTLRGNYAACTQLAALDMSVLGRDILDMFTLIVDRPGNQIALIGGEHHYSIGTQRAPSAMP